MYRPRIIPVLLLKNNELVKSIQFRKHRYIGDPLNAVKLFNDLKADELVFLDIEASRMGKSISIELVAKISEEANMPFAVGGGISTTEQIKNLLRAGAERVIINTAFLKDSGFITKAVEHFGSSSISVCLDIKKSWFGKYKPYNTHYASKEKDIVSLALKAEACGAGELIIQSVDRDGTFEGYDIHLISQIAKQVSIPVVALGGAKNMQNIRDCYNATGVNGLGAGSLFVYYGNSKGVLINYPNKFKESGTII